MFYPHPHGHPLFFCCPGPLITLFFLAPPYIITNFTLFSSAPPFFITHISPLAPGLPLGDGGRTIWPAHKHKVKYSQSEHIGARNLNYWCEGRWRLDSNTSKSFLYLCLKYFHGIFSWSPHTLQTILLNYVRWLFDSDWYLWFTVNIQDNDKYGYM